MRLRLSGNSLLLAGSLGRAPCRRSLAAGGCLRCLSDNQLWLRLRLRWQLLDCNLRLEWSLRSELRPW